MEDAKLKTENQKCEDTFVTLEQIKRSGTVWDFRTMVSYSMDTLLPTYEEFSHG